MADETPAIRALLLGNLVMRSPTEWPALRDEVRQLCLDHRALQEFTAKLLVTYCGKAIEAARSEVETIRG